MRTRPPAGTTTARFSEVAFHRVPLACLAVAAAAGAVGGAAWSERLAAVPWLVSLGFVGLPHGAADCALSRRAWRGGPLAARWLAYLAVMAAVAAGFVAAPLPSIAVFVALSCWHFGSAHSRHADPASGGLGGGVAAAARGGIVLAVPLAAWPRETAAAAADLIRLASPGLAGDLPTPQVVRTIGLVLAGLTGVAVAVEAALSLGRPGGPRRLATLLVDLAVIAGLGLATDPLFSVGLYFLAWHAWRQMEPLAAALTGAVPGSWAELGRALARIHAAALPLLIPTWLAIGAAWWFQSPDHSARDLAVLSIGCYLVVTPAHELLNDLLPAALAGPPASRISAAD